MTDDETARLMDGCFEGTVLSTEMPNCFYFAHRSDEDCGAPMEKLQAKMNNFYRAKIEKKKRVLGPIPEEENEDEIGPYTDKTEENKANNSSVESKERVNLSKNGEYVAVEWKNQWRRGRMVQTSQNQGDSHTVLLADVGRVLGGVKSTEIHFLPHCFREASGPIYKYKLDEISQIKLQQGVSADGATLEYALNQMSDILKLQSHRIFVCPKTSLHDMANTMDEDFEMDGYSVDKAFLYGAKLPSRYGHQV